MVVVRATSDLDRGRSIANRISTHGSTRILLRTPLRNAAAGTRNKQCLARVYEGFGSLRTRTVPEILGGPATMPDITPVVTEIDWSGRRPAPPLDAATEATRQ